MGHSRYPVAGAAVAGRFAAARAAGATGFVAGARIRRQSASNACGNWLIRWHRNRFIPAHFCRTSPWRHAHRVGAPAVSGADFNKENGMTYPDLNSRPAPDRFIRRWLVITGCIAALMLLWQFLPAIEAWFSPREAAERTVTPRGDLAADEQTTIQLFEKSRGSVVYITTAQLVRDVWSRNVFPCRAAPAPASSGTMPATW